MKFKHIVSLLLCVSLILNFTVDVKADASIFNDVFYTAESIDGFFDGNFGNLNISDLASDIYQLNNEQVDSSFISSVNEFVPEPDTENSAFLLTADSVGTPYIYYFWSENYDPIYVLCDSTSQADLFYLVSQSNINITGYFYNYSNDSWAKSYFSFLSGGTVNGYQYYYNTSSVSSIVSVKNIDVILHGAEYFEYYGENLPSGLWAVNMVDNYINDVGDFTNFYSEDLPYYDGSEIIDPSEDLVEGNKNHMYFNNCDFGFCEPINVNNFSNYGGAYFYVKYNVDDWVLNHIGDYKIEFNVDCYVGNQHFPFTTRQALDPDLVLTIPFSYFDGFNYGFSTYITNQKIDKSFLKTYLYCIKPDQYTSFYNKLNSVQSDQDLHSMLNELADNDLDFPFIFCYTNSLSTYLIKNEILTTEFLNQLFYNNRFTITCNARLIDESGNESGWVSREFDIVRGSSISTNNDGLTNEDPFNDDSSEFLPDVPSNYEVVGTGTNNSTGVSVYNMTPENIKMTIDNGLKDFVSWYNTDESVGNAAHSFWNNMGIFKDNPASSLYQQYFGFLPDDFKSLIFGACGIGIVGGAFCILRKKLT